MFAIIYAICFVLAIIVMSVLILVHTRNEARKQLDLWYELKAKYPDIKTDNFDPLLYLVFHNSTSYLESDCVIFYKYNDGVTHCIHFNGDLDKLLIDNFNMNIMHIIQHKKSVNFKVSSPILPKIEIIE